MKRQDFAEFMSGFDKDKTFGMTYKKKNGDIRIATCRLRDEVADSNVKGTGMNRKEKMEKLQVFQYFDVNSNAYRSARLENIIDITVDDAKFALED